MHTSALRIAVAALFAAATPLAAQQTEYADRSAFLAALTPGATTITFDGVVPAGMIDAPLPSQIGTATFSRPVAWLPAASTEVFAYANPYYSLSSYPNLMVTSAGGPIGYRVDFGGSVTAFGVDYSAPWGSGVSPIDNYSFVLYNGATPLYSIFRQVGAMRPSFDFVGVTSTQPFTSVVVTSSNISLYDNLTYGDVTPMPPVTSTPEPASLALFGTGLGALIVVPAVRRRRAVASPR